MDDAVDVDRLIDALIDREGGFVDHPADKGGPTCFGITEAVARAHGYAGPMRHLPRREAAAIYRRLYWLRPRFDEVARRSPRLAADCSTPASTWDPRSPSTFLQRALTALNRNGQDYPDLTPDGRIGADASRARRLPRRAWHRASARPCCCARSRRCRASATFASPSGGQPTRRSFMGGWRTGSVSG